jgi:hypothetical protein
MNGTPHGRLHERVPQERRMKDPRKEPYKRMFLNFSTLWNSGIATMVRLSDDDVEYILAPVWLDAVKDPPKENIDYWVITRKGWKGALKYWRGEWFGMNGTYFMEKVDDVIWYMPIFPQPTERSGE